MSTLDTLLPEPKEDAGLYVPKSAIPEFKQFSLDTGDLWGTAMKQESIPYMALGSREHLDSQESYVVDPLFDDQKKRQYIDTLGTQIHPRYMDVFMENSRNEAHMAELSSHYEEESAKLRYLEDQPWYKGLGYSAAAELTNLPLVLGAIYAAPATAATIGSSALLSAGSGAVTSLILDEIKDRTGEIDVTGTDRAIGAVMSSGIGALAGHFTKEPLTQAAEKHIARAAGVDDVVMEQIKKAATLEEKKDIIKKAVDEKAIQPEQGLLDEIDSLVHYAAKDKDKNAVQRFWEAGRQDLAYAVSKSPSKTMQQFGDKTFTDATLQNIDPDSIDFATHQVLMEESLRGDRNNFLMPFANRFADITHAGLYSRKVKATSGLLDDFGDLLGSIQTKKSLFGMNSDTAVDQVLQTYVKQQDIASNKIAELEDLLKEASQEMEEYALRLHQRWGEEGHIDFKKNQDGESIVPENRNYFPKIYSPNKIAQLQNDGVTRGIFVNFLKDSLRSKNPNLDDDLLDEMATSLFGKMIASKDSVAVKEKSLFYELSKDQDISDEARGSFARELTEFDYGFKKKYKINDTKEIELSFEDIVENNYTHVMDSYIRKMSGTTAIQNHVWKPKPRAIKSKEAQELAYERTPRLTELDKEIAQMREAIEAGKQAETGAAELIDIAKKELGDIIEAVMPRVKHQRKAAYKNQVNAIIDDIVELVTSGDLGSIQKAIADATGIEGVEIPESTLSYLSKQINDVQKGKTLDPSELIKERKDLLKRQTQKIIDEALNPSERTLYSQQDIDDFRNHIKDELNEQVEAGAISSRKAEKEMVRLDSILKEMTGEATAVDPTGGLQKANRIVQSFNLMRMLGSTAFTMATEGIAAAWDGGVHNLITKSPYMQDLLRSYRTGTFEREELQELHNLTGAFDEFMTGPKMYEFIQEQSALSTSGKRTKADKIENIGAAGAEFTLMTGGVKVGTAFFKAVNMVTTTDLMRKVANGGKKSKSYDKMIKELGFSTKTEQSIYNEIKKHAKDNIMNYDKWDPQVKRMIAVGLKRRSDTVVQSQRLGDELAWVVGDSHMAKDGVAGKMAMSLKKFAMTAYTKQLGRAVSRADAYVASMFAAQIFVATTMYVARSAWTYQDSNEKRFEALKPENIARGAISIMPQVSVLPELLGGVEGALTSTGLIKPSRRHQLSDEFIGSIPAFDFANQLGKTVPGILGPIIEDEPYKPKDFTPLMKLFGVKNHWATRPAAESWLDEPRDYGR